MGTTGVRTRHLGLAAGLLLVGAAGTAHAQLNTTASTTATPQLGSARIIEWDLPGNVDFNPGAMVVDTRGEDNNTVWFVTRLGGPSVYKFDLQSSLMKNGGTARWTAWSLSPEDNMGGIRKMRPSHDRRFVAVRTPTTIEEVDTQACAGAGSTPTTCGGALRRWEVPEDPEATGPGAPFVSDIA